jgi:threonine/homoserine/homoserine lactone efflux protein
VPDLSTMVVFAGAALVLLLIPGPAVLYITTRSVTQGRAAGMASVLGIATGSLVHVAAATVGLSALLVGSAVAFHTVRSIGAACLVALGVLSDGAYALISAALGDRLRDKAGSRRAGVVSGLVYVGLGVATAANSSRA